MLCILVVDSVLNISYMAKYLGIGGELMEIGVQWIDGVGTRDNLTNWILSDIHVYTSFHAYHINFVGPVQCKLRLYNINHEHIPFFSQPRTL